MLVTGAQKATIAALLGGQRMVWADVPRDDVTIRKIVHHGARFWERIQRRDMPAPTAAKARGARLRRSTRTGSGVVVLPHSAIDAADELETLKAKRKELDRSIDVIENTVRAALGDAETGAMTDGRSFSWKLQNRKSFVVEASSFRVLRLHQPKNRK
jgi:predicted phage-related endonuclease